MLFDTHMHTRYSCDGEMTYQEAIAAANKLNIGMIVTEHWDYDYPTNPEEFLFDIDAYFKNFESLRSDYVLRGIEIGMQRTTAERDEAVAAGHDFDYVLASIHCIGKRDLYEPTCYECRTRQEIVEEFLDDSIYCVEQHDNFDAFAHIDYICRYWPYAEKELCLADNQAKYDKVFKLLIDGNKPIEINTRRLDSKEAIKALIPLYERYKALGGRYCTLGSDAHYLEHIGRRLDKALEIAKVVGLQPVYFKERKIEALNNYNKKLEYSDGEYAIIVAKTSEDLNSEGINLHHCVGSYVGRVQNGDCSIFFLRKANDLETSLITIEVRENKVIQVRGLCERLMDDNERKFFNKWVNEKNLAFVGE